MPLLRPKEPRRIVRKRDWFSSKHNPHFDLPLSRVDATTLVSNAANVVAHSFLPLMCFTKADRRFRSAGSDRPKGSLKPRPLAYCANRDGYIFSYYAHLLAAPYEAELAKRGLTNSVIAYRKITINGKPGASNIELARDAFVEIRQRGTCLAIALDIKGFFDNIDHRTLKRSWLSLIGYQELPPDHYTVFRTLTRYRYVDRKECLTRLGRRPRTPHSELLPRICTPREFREKIRGDDGLAPSLIKQNVNRFGIPQGTPLSAMAANIAMLEFDTMISQYVASLGGSYRRYSDDILLILPPSKPAQYISVIDDAMREATKTLKIHPGKTQITRFTSGKLSPASRPLQYLGFTFDGSRALLRDTTLSRYWRRMANSVRWAIRERKKAIKGRIEGRPQLHRRELLARYTHLGSESFNRGYATRAHKGMGDFAQIKRQLRNHMRILKNKIQFHTERNRLY